MTRVDAERYLCERLCRADTHCPPGDHSAQVSELLRLYDQPPSETGGFRSLMTRCGRCGRSLDHPSSGAFIKTAYGWMCEVCAGV